MLDLPGEVERLGKLTVDLLADTGWINRRVETIRHIDKHLLEERVSLDLSSVELTSRLARAGYGADDAVPVFLAIPRKQLLLDIDVTINGAPLSVDGRGLDVDMSAAALAMMLRAATEPDIAHAMKLMEAQAYSVTNLEERADLLADLETNDPGLVLYRELRRVADRFPPRLRPRWRSGPIQNASHGRPSRLRDYSQPISWLGDQVGDPFERYVELFWRSFLLRATISRDQLELDPILVKIRYVHAIAEQRVPFRKRLGFRAVYGTIPVTSFGFGRSEHVRLLAPPGLVFTYSDLRQFDKPEPGDNPLRPGIAYSHRITPGTTHLYVTGRAPMPDATFELAYALRPGDSGVASSAWWLTLVLAGLLAAGRRWICDLANAESDAAVALLLVVPSALTLFMARGTEHALYRWVMRPLRALVLLAGLAPLVAGFALLVFGTTGLVRVWSSCTFMVAGVAFVCLAVKVLNVFAERSVRRVALTTYIDRAHRRPYRDVIRQLETLIDRSTLSRVLRASRRQYRDWWTGRANPPTYRAELLRDIFRNATPHERPPVGPVPIVLRQLDRAEADERLAAARAALSRRETKRLAKVVWRVYRLASANSDVIEFGDARRPQEWRDPYRQAIDEAVRHIPDRPWETRRYTEVEVPDIDGGKHAVAGVVLPLGVETDGSVTASAFLAAAGTPAAISRVHGALSTFARAWSAPRPGVC